MLLGEKVIIQMIAYNFHQRSYADRIEDQRAAIRTLVVLYRHSVDIPGRTDTLREPTDPPQKDAARRIWKKAIHGVRGVAQTGATILGNVASEIAGTYVEVISRDQRLRPSVGPYFSRPARRRWYCQP